MTPYSKEFFLYVGHKASRDVISTTKLNDMQGHSEYHVIEYSAYEIIRTALARAEKNLDDTLPYGVVSERWREKYYDKVAELMACENERDLFKMELENRQEYP